MSDILDPQNTPPVTRREILENGPSEKGLLGARTSYTTATEPLPEVVDSGDRDFRLEPSLNTGVQFEQRGLVIGAFTMVFISFALFWVPVLGAMLAGAFGGFFAKRWKSGFMAAAFASVAVPIALAFLNLWMKTGALNFTYGMNFLGWSALHIVAMFIGTAAGVYSRPHAERRGLREDIWVG